MSSKTHPAAGLNRAYLTAVMLLLGVSPADDVVVAQQRLVVGTREVPPFAMRDQEGQWTGISIELLSDIRSDLANSGFPSDIEFREMTLEEMLAAVERGEVDLAVAALTVNYEREMRMDFSHPFHSSGLGIAVGRQQLRTWDAVLLSVFSISFLRLLGALLIVLLISGVAVYVFEHKQNPEQFGGGPVKGIAAGIWWAAVTMTTVGYGDKVPKTALGRIVGLLWMFVGLFIVAGFTAAVTSRLTVSRLQSRIAGPSDLSRFRVATVAESTSDDYLSQRHIVARSYADLGGALNALASGDVEAVVYDAPVLRYETHRRYAGELHVLPAVFERQDYAFALPSESALREPLNQAVLQRIARPDWQERLAGYLGEELE